MSIVVNVIDINGEFWQKTTENRARRRRRVPIITRSDVGFKRAPGVRRRFSRINQRKRATTRRTKNGGKKAANFFEKIFVSALYKREVRVIMTVRLAEVAELADALGSGPSPRNWGWRFESSLRHRLRVRFRDELFFLFLGAYRRSCGERGRERTDVALVGARRRDEIGKRRNKGKNDGLKRRRKRRLARKFRRRNRVAASAPLFFRARPDTIITTILRGVASFPASLPIVGPECDGALPSRLSLRARRDASAERKAFCK